jgi:peptidyl-prolyl cis-trans isomerase D
MDPAFENAAFSLSNKGDVSGVVKSDFGYHIIKLTDVKSEQVTAFESVKEEITNKVKTIKAEDSFYEISERIKEVAFEVPDNLDEVNAQILELDNPKKRDKMRNDAFEFYKLHQDASYTFKEIMENIKNVI